jgi:hypothetical protein
LNDVRWTIRLCCHGLSVRLKPYREHRQESGAGCRRSRRIAETGCSRVLLRRQAVADAGGRRRPTRGRSRASPRAVSVCAGQAGGCRQPQTRGSRRSCSGWFQSPPSAVPARLRAGYVTGIPAATRLPLVAQLQPAPSDENTYSLNPGIDDPCIAPIRAIENHPEITNHLPFTLQFSPTNFTPKKASASTELRTIPVESNPGRKPPQPMIGGTQNP